MVLLSFFSRLFSFFSPIFFRFFFDFFFDFFFQKKSIFFHYFSFFIFIFLTRNENFIYNIHLGEHTEQLCFSVFTPLLVVYSIAETVFCKYKFLEKKKFRPCSDAAIEIPHPSAFYGLSIAATGAEISLVTDERTDERTDISKLHKNRGHYQLYRDRVNLCAFELGSLIWLPFENRLRYGNFMHTVSKRRLSSFCSCR